MQKAFGPFSTTAAEWSLQTMSISGLGRVIDFDTAMKEAKTLLPEDLPMTTVNSRDNPYYVLVGQIDNGDTISNGGIETVNSGGEADATTVDTGGSLVVDVGGTANGTIVSNGGGAFVYGSASGTQVNAGGTEYVQASGVDNGTTLNGGTEIVAAGGTINGTVTFVGGGTLVVNQSTNLGGGAALVGFNSPNDVLDLENISFAANPIITWKQDTSTSGTLTVTDGTNTASIILLGQYTTANFTLAPDGNDGTDVFDPTPLYGPNYHFLPLTGGGNIMDLSDLISSSTSNATLWQSGNFTTDQWGKIVAEQWFQYNPVFGTTIAYSGSFEVSYDQFGRATSATEFTSETITGSGNGMPSTYSTNWVFTYDSDDLSQPSAYEGNAIQGYAYTNPISSGARSYTFNEYSNDNPNPFGALLFTPNAEVVNFNGFTPTQGIQVAFPSDMYVWSASLGRWTGPTADIYHGLGGNDVVTLPGEASYNESIYGVPLGWTDTAASTFYTGSQIGDTYSVKGTDGDYYIVEGAGTEIISVNDKGYSHVGSSNITAGTGADTITIISNGDNIITAGSGVDTITITGNGQNTITTGSGNETLSISGGGTLKVNGALVGSATIGANSTLELNGPASGGPITFDPSGTKETLQIDGTTMPTNVISGLAASDPTASNDVIDLADVPFSNTGYWLFQAATAPSSNILTIVDNGLVGSNAYTLKSLTRQRRSPALFRCLRIPEEAQRSSQVQTLYQAAHLRSPAIRTLRADRVLQYKIHTAPWSKYM